MLASFHCDRRPRMVWEAFFRKLLMLTTDATDPKIEIGSAIVPLIGIDFYAN